MVRLDAVIMASGLSRRMGRNKLLLPLGGSTVIDQFLAQFPSTLFEKVILVYGDPQVAAIAARYPVILLHNTHPAGGKSHTIQLGLAESTAEDGVLFAVADQPLLREGTIRSLVEMFYRQQAGRIIVPQVAGKPANPVIFPAFCRKEFAALRGDSGGRQLINKTPGRVCLVPFGAAEEFADVDTPEAYQRVVKWWAERKKTLQ